MEINLTNDKSSKIKLYKIIMINKFNRILFRKSRILDTFTFNKEASYSFYKNDVLKYINEKNNINNYLVSNKKAD